MEERATKTEGVIKPTEQPVTDKDKKSQQQDKVSRKPLLKRIRLMHRRHYQGQVNEIARGFTALVLHVYS